MPRRKSSSFYSVDGKDGAKKSPFVLDLRKYSKDKQAGMQKVNESPVIERLKRSAERYGASPKPLVRGRRDSSIFSDDDLTRDAILGELDKFENYETELASIISVPEGERPEVEYPQVRKPPLRLIPERRNKYKEDEKNTYPSEQAILSYFEKKNSEPLAEQYTDDKYLQEISQDPDFHEFFSQEDSIEDYEKVKKFLEPAPSVEPEHDREEAYSVESFEKPHNQLSASGVFRRIASFSVVSIIIMGVVMGGFFVQKGIRAKDESVSRGIEAYENFKSAGEALEELDFEKAAEDFSKAHDAISKAQDSIKEVGNLTITIAENVPFDSHADSAMGLLGSVKHIALAGESLSSAFSILPLDKLLSPESMISLLAAGTESSGVYSPEVFESFTTLLNKAESEIAIANSELRNVKASDFPAEFQASVLDLKQKIPAIANLIGLAKNYSGISAELLGKDSPKRYLLIFQNSSELRPTGGFIGSYAVVEFDKGKLTNLMVDGIYNADGQLTVNIIPPEQFQHITTAWSTHDANWFFDFPTSAQKIAWFYEMTGGGKVDGVITLNVEVIESLLGVTGPIGIEKYGVTLDSSNFRDEVQYEVEVAYDKKLNRPKQVLTDFTPLFIARLAEVSKTSGKEVFSKMLASLSEKNIMFYFRDAKVQEFIAGQGWSGSIEGMAESSSEGLLSAGGSQNSDYLAVVHSNIGGYKTNKFTKDKVDYRVEVKEDGSFVGNLRIEMSHNGGGSKYWWYNRDSVDYLKIYVPKGAEIISVSGGVRREVKDPVDYEKLKFEKDSDVLAIESAANKSGAIDIFQESGKTVFGTWLVTKPKAKSALEISYKLPFDARIEANVGKYNLMVQKQAGVKPDMSFKMSVPGGWDIVWSNMTDASGENSFVLDKDRIIGYIFKK